MSIRWCETMQIVDAKIKFSGADQLDHVMLRFNVARAQFGGAYSFVLNLNELMLNIE